ncbi:RNI-like protein [Dioscorea alata]|uniref:RNI-like protein n=1 Tax=Dioscorea alata TaxID=55571 RepID=A0ACB7UNN9_DIOAL|nr:RNI-like protein [Dioscorea alata]
MIMRNCPRLTSLMPFRLCQRNLQELWSLQVQDCPMMLELFPCDQGGHNITELLPGLMTLYLIGLQSLQDVLQLFQCLPNLKKLSIDDCGVRYVVSSEMETVAILADPFPALENIDIRNCQEMSEMISPLASLQAPCFFQRLGELHIKSCSRLTHLFSYKQAISMQHLSDLSIEDCVALEAVVISKENEEEASASTSTQSESYNNLFPNLRQLSLENLPQLTTTPPVEWLHLTRYYIEGCPKLQEPLEDIQSLPNVLQPFRCLANLKFIICACELTISPFVFPTLEVLVIKDCQEMSEMISPPASLQASCFFQGLCELHIKFCPRLTHIFSYKQAMSMQHLTVLCIEFCHALEAVVIYTENKEEASSSAHVVDHESYNSPFPNLRDLRLVDLPQLTTFHQPTTSSVEWLHLTSYKILGCPKLQEPLEGLQSVQNVVQPFQCLPNLKVLSINDCGVRYVVSSKTETVAILTDPFPTLEFLVIRSCQEMSEMISPPASLQAQCFFQRLRSLRIKSCPRLTHLFSYKQAISMQHLSRLYIRDCAVLGAVVISKENEEEESARTSTHVVECESYNNLFPNLRHLRLEKLPQLTAFHHPTAPPVEWLHLTSYKIQKCPKLHEPLEERIRSLRARMEKKKPGSVKGEEEEGEEKEASDLLPLWYLEEEEEDEGEEEEEDEGEEEEAGDL